MPAIVFASSADAVPAGLPASGGGALLVVEAPPAPAGALLWPRDSAAIIDWLIQAGAAAARKAASEALLGFARSQLIGQSPAFHRMMAQLCKATAAAAPVLLVGPTGTGKELLARAIHYCGDRAGRGLAAVNCGALPESLLESELFGHRRGAFTDARENRAGLVTQADGGTLFLDEVDALSPRAQAALLRFLQSGEYRPVGSDRTLATDARIVSASNADLGRLVREGLFREDLYYRLAVLTIETPRLADRGGDVTLLARHFLARSAEAHGLPARRFSPRALAAMQAHDWPGNVRELENYVQRACIMADGPEIDLLPGEDALSPRMPAEPGPSSPDLPSRDLPSPAPAAPSPPGRGGGFHSAKAAAIAAFERDYLAGVLAAAAGNVTRAARMAGVERRTFGRLAKRYGLLTRDRRKRRAHSPASAR